ncbi:MAG: DUF6599 family protein [Candidatus Glassbacteria bacterium]
MNAANRPESLENAIQAPAGWEPSGYQGSYAAANLHEYLDGGAERYLGYGFRQLLVREFLENGTAYKVIVEIYRLDCPANAFGIYSSDRAGKHPQGIGRDAALGDYLLQFWQDSYFVRIQDIDLAGVSRSRLAEFGRAVSAGLPTGSSQDYPPILALLPSRSLDPESVCYFHTRNSLNSFVYLGDDNLLGLDETTQAVTAEYETGAQPATFRLVLIQYQDAGSCSRSQRRLAEAAGRIAQAGNLEIGRITAIKNFLFVTFGAADQQTLDGLESAVANKIR